MGEIIRSIRQKPVIAALRGEQLLEAALASTVSTVFYLHADIFRLGELTEKARERGKIAFFHLEFIDGLGRDGAAVQYLSKTARPDGVITTRVNSVKEAKDAGLFAVQRFFMVDRQSYDTAVKNIEIARPDMIELMPGIIPQIIRQMASDTNIPVIAGGLVTTKEEAFLALQAGAAAVSTGTQDLWNMYK
jgi:glycerol uptake operon antiterminator